MNEPKQHKSLCGFQKGTLAKLRRICGPDFPLCVDRRLGLRAPSD